PQEPVLSLTTNDVTLTNTGAAPLDLSSVAATGDFGEVDNCPRTPATLATGSACTITVKFTPSSGDVPSAGTLTLTDNVPGGSQSIPLSGSGAWGQMQASSEPLAFGASDINPSGATAIAIETLTFPGPATIVTGFRADIPFFVNNVDCPLSQQLSSGASCHVQVGFDPTIAGNYSGQFAILDNEPGLRHPIGVSGTANPIPVAITLNVTPTDRVPTFGRLLDVTATSSSPFGTATFSLNGHQVGAPVDLGGSGSAFVAIPLDDTTIPAGAGTYSLLVTVHPTDGVHSDSAVSQSVTVFPAATQISSTGTGLAVQGTAVTLAATVSVPPLQSQFDYAANPVWVRFDVIDGAGSTRTYYARVGSAGSASVAVTGLTPGAYSVRGRLVGTSGSLSPNPYLTSEDLRSAFAVEPVRGGFVAGAGPGIAFEFAPGGIATGSLQWVENVQAPGPDGQQHDAYRIITSTSIGSVTSHSHIATVNGSVSIVVVDATTGVQFSATAAAFQLTVAADGSVLVTTNGGASASLPPGSAVNHL
ncbi:MAG: choice-of-anchor D domain-containing protein, partial [Chloroflexi bacterium]